MSLVPRLGRLPQLQDTAWFLSREWVPPEFARLTSLTRLKLSFYWSPATTGSLQQLSSLTGLQDLYLDLWTSPGQGPPGGISLEFLTPAFASLDQLALRAAGVEALPPAVTALQQLTRLDLSDNWFEAPGSLEGLQQVSNLRWLSLGQAGLAALPPAVMALQQLTYLNMTLSSFETPGSLEGLQQLSNLRRLSLKAAGLAALPPGVAALQQLTHLDLSENCFERPGSLEGLQQLSNLRRLSLCWYRLVRLPPLLTALRELHLETNGELQVTAAEVRGMLEHMPGLTSLMFDKSAAQRLPAAEWVQLVRAWPEVRVTFG